MRLVQTLKDVYTHASRRQHKCSMSLVRLGTLNEQYCFIIKKCGAFSRRKRIVGEREKASLPFRLCCNFAKHHFTFTQVGCYTVRMSVEIVVNLSNLISADRQGGKRISAVEVMMELVREKIIIRHDPLRSPTHCFEPKPERMYGFAGVCGLSD